MNTRFARPQPNVICLGQSVYDVSWHVASLPQGPGKTRASAHHQGGGGNAANAAVAVTRLGGRGQLWSRSGLDATGRLMRAELEALGVDARHLRLFENVRASVSAVIVDGQGERMIINYRDDTLPDAADWLPLQEIAEADAVVADPRWVPAVAQVFDAAREAGKPRVLDGEPSEPQVFEAILPRTSHAVFSEPGLARYAPAGATVHDQLLFAHSRGCEITAVTLGERGVLWLDRDGMLRSQPAFPVEVVDTTGAGDVFHGALAWALGAGLGERDAFRFSAAVAALKCTRAGGREGIPRLQQVLEFLAAHASRD